MSVALSDQALGCAGTTLKGAFPPFGVDSYAGAAARAWSPASGIYAKRCDLWQV